MKERMNKNALLAKRSAIREFSNLAKNTSGCIALTLGEPDFDTPECISEQLTTAIENKETHYIANDGDKALLEKISLHEAKTRNLNYTSEEIIVTCGATEAIFTALFGILEAGDEVIIPTPAFVLYEQVVQLFGAKPVFLDISETDFQIYEERLLSLINSKTKAIILNSPNNPTGCVLNKESLNAVYSCVKQRDIFVICDDVYANISYKENPSISFAQFSDLKKKIIAISGFSKTYAMTGWRLGWLMADKEIKERLSLLHQYTVTSTPSLFQRSAAAALDYDNTEMLETYKKRRDYVLQRLDDMGLEYPACDGAFYVFPSIKKFGISSDDFCKQLISKALLAVTPGSCFGTDGHIRISYCYSDEVLKEGLDRLERFINTLKQGEELYEHRLA